jgi:excisionase family DNA binding protein
VGGELLSVDDVAARLGLHSRTIRNYVHDGRLKAVRIGKQYRIAVEDLDQLTARPALALVPAAGVDATGASSPTSRVIAEVSSVAQIDGISRADAEQLVTSVIAANDRPATSNGPLHIDTVYDPHRERLKIIVLGGVAATAAMFRMLDLLLEQSA